MKRKQKRIHDGEQSEVKDHGKQGRKEKEWRMQGIVAKPAGIGCRGPKKDLYVVAAIPSSQLEFRVANTQKQKKNTHTPLSFP